MLIGLAGLKESGKSTVAKYLSAKHNYVEYEFARPLKEAIKFTFDMTEDQLYVNKEIVDPRYNLTPRQIMQKFGTDFIRDMIDPDFFLNKFEYWHKSNSSNSNVVISDVRFPNELNRIHKLGGKVYLIERTNCDRKQDVHVSEDIISLVSSIDGIIVNDGTVEDLLRKVEKLILQNE